MYTAPSIFTPCNFNFSWFGFPIKHPSPQGQQRQSEASLEWKKTGLDLLATSKLCMVVASAPEAYSPARAQRVKLNRVR